MPGKTNQKTAKSKKNRKVSPRISSGVREEDASYEAQALVFLTLAEVLKFHTRQLELFGGTDGVRDMSLLESALAQPESGFGGHWLHEDLFEMAAAYAFHICKNHPFFDGNKRTALDVALVFLEINGIDFRNPKEVFIPIMLSVAEGKMSKKELAQVFRGLPKE
jgi:death-on-curing protein